MFAIAGVEFDGTMICRFATPEACLLFGMPNPVGFGADSIFANWFTKPDLGTGVSVGHHADGRVFHCESRHDSAGVIRAVLTDISTHLRDHAQGASDALTGLATREALKGRLQGSCNEATKDVGIALHHIDLDRMKSINDTLGYAVGDRLLVKVAERLRALVAPGGIAARLGGDEFALLQSGVTDGAQAATLGERLVDLVGRTYVVDGHMLNIGASVGIALAGNDGDDPETLLRHADLALHQAKIEGGGRTRFFEPQMSVQMHARRSLELDLRLALSMRQFRLHFQPLHDLATDRISGFEALLRWTHADRGSVPPMDFIPLAEEVGLIGVLGEWVLRTACREAATWPEPMTVAVNISPHQLRRGGLVDTVVDVLAATGLSATRLELEITEGALLDGTTVVLETLHALRALGVRISMDDFGTGYSSLSYLRTFPFDKIKIDQSFIRGLGIDDECDAILRAVSTLGASLGMRTTAKGVETREQMDRVRQEGCTEVQGYLTGRPLSRDDARARLEMQQEEQP